MTMDAEKKRLIAAVGMGVIACIFIALAVVLYCLKIGTPALPVAFSLCAVILAIVGAGILTGQTFKKLDIGFGKDKVVAIEYFEQVQTQVQLVPPKTLDDETRTQREQHAQEALKDRPLPGVDAPRFSAVLQSNACDLLVRPSAYPMTPMYLLDNAYRILDWNEAFSAAFDRTMEGRKGRGVLEWTYFLDNYEQVLDHGLRVFGDPNNLPAIDVESIDYTSQRYGKLSATKRAYRIPDDSGAVLAWLVTLDVKFADPRQGMTYKQDLIRLLGLDLMWSEYAVSYDRILNNTQIYPDLLDRMIGGVNGLSKIPDDSRILDLGAGTGNLSYKLITTCRDRQVFAAENNRIMLEILRTKCQKFLRADADAGGVVTLKQDITSLFGLEDNSFDFALSNNVLYSVQDPKSCLEETCRVLKPGGELRLSGPRKDTNLEALFERIQSDLQHANKFEELESDYQHVWQINKLRLGPWLYRWSTKDVEKMLLDAGFSTIVHASEDAYAGQSMLISARK